MYAFGDSFDLYSAAADMWAGYWDSNPGGSYAGLTSPGRFNYLGSQASSVGAYEILRKDSGHNDAIHHITVAVTSPSISGTGRGFFINFMDAGTAQCSILFMQNGSIVLYSGNLNTNVTPGTILDTYTGAITVANQWYVFEFEVVINNTTGSWTIRKNGNTGTADHTLGSLNTRGGTSNNYANGIAIGAIDNWGPNQSIDDFLWRSDPSSVPWIGDVRCYTRLPASSVSSQFSVTGTATQELCGAYGNYSVGANTALYYPFIATANATINSIQLDCSGGGGGTGNYKFAIYSDNGGVPGTLLGTSVNVNNPPASLQTVAMATGVAVTNGTKYWIGQNQDFTIYQQSGGNTTATPFNVYQFASAFSSWPPASNPTTGQSVAGTNAKHFFINYTPAANWQGVCEPHQDGTTTYVFDSTVGDHDFYSIAARNSPAPPATTLLVTTRGFMQRSDAGSRQAAMQLKSGSTTVQSPSTQPTTGSFLWLWRADQTDPNTSAAWVPSAVDALQLGPIVIS